MNFIDVLGTVVVLIAGGLIGIMFKRRGGQIAIAVLAAAVGLFGLGYFFGHDAASSTYYGLLRSARGDPYAITDVAKLREVIEALAALGLRPDVPGWMLFVSIVLVFGGCFAALSLIEDYAMQIARRELQAKAVPPHAAQEQPEEGAA